MHVRDTHCKELPTATCLTLGKQLIQHLQRTHLTLCMRTSRLSQQTRCKPWSQAALQCYHMPADFPQTPLKATLSECLVTLSLNVLSSDRQLCARDPLLDEGTHTPPDVCLMPGLMPTRTLKSRRLSSVGWMRCETWCSYSAAATELAAGAEKGATLVNLAPNSFACSASCRAS